MPDIQSSINQIGLTQIYRSREDPQVDIVFVHGLNGHPYNTWASKSDKNPVFWPTDFLPDILGPKRVRILTYGYNASVHSFTDGASTDRIHNHAENLASLLAANRNLRECSDRPIIFVCHSLGGLVVKRALIHCKNVSSEKIEHLRSIYVSTYGILFLGTPHNGSDIARWGMLLQNICNAVLPKKFVETSPHLVKALRTNNETLQNINSLFAEIMGRYHIYFFHESRSTDLRGSRGLIVDESSAAPYVEGVERMGIDADHSSMCKFDNENAPGYEAVAEALLRYSRDAPGTISTRWAEEKKSRNIYRETKAREIMSDSADDLTKEKMSDMHQLGNLPILLKDDRTPSASRRTSASSNHSKKDPLLVAPPGFHPNLNFVGMTEELRALNVRLFKEKRAERLLAALICGVSGSGKTHLARQYVWTHRGSFPGGIFWVDAKSTQSRYKCFWDIAQAATIHEGKEFGNADTKSNHNYVDAVRDWLQSREEWLLVFDGLNFDHEDDLDSFKQFLPFNKKCNIIYTSVDRTLRKRQRLFEPHTVHVRPLRIEDACKLLFKDLDIRRPTPDQVRKATELVEHYEGLPLAIHAISHRLSATSKPIEKYHIDSHLTDEKLAEPFLGIMHDLYRMGHFEALNLINVMSFLGHHIPVGLLILGRAVLETWNVEILTPSRPGAHGDIDTTLGILIRCGLIERTTESYSVSSPKGRSYDDTLVKAVAPDLSESQTESSQETFFSANQSTRTIDVIKMHSVIQGFCRDELTIMDDERQMTSPGSTEASFYESWLVVATRVLCTSYENGRAKMMRDTLVRDYREYETHASRLMEHFPKKPPESQLVAETMEDLKLVIGSIGCQLSKASPSPSQESIQKQRSVFDRSSSSSSSAPDSSADEGCARQVWDWSDGTSFKVESPGEISVGPHYFNLKPFLPHTYREPTMSREDGYETDGEGPKFRISPALSQGSHATEKAKSSPASSPPQMDDKEWNLKEKHSKSKLGKDKLKRRKRLPHDFRKPKPAVPMLNVFQVAGRGASSPMMNTGRRGSLESSEAKKSLRAMGEGSRGRQTKSADYSIFGKENMPTYVTTAASHALGEEQGRYSQRSLSLRGQGQSLSPGLQPKPSGESLESRIASMQPSRLSSELKPEEIGQPSGGAHYDFNRPRLNIMDTRTAPGTRYHSRRPSSAGYEPVGDMTASAPSLVSYYPQPIPYETDITVTEPQRRLGSPPGGQLASSSPSSHPSAFMPGVSPPHSHTTDAPTGYVSDPVLSEPMSRDPSNQSNQSNQSWSTEPARYPPRLSPLQSNQGFPPPFSQHPQHLLTETGGWVGDTHSQVSALPEPPHSRIRPVGFDEHLFGRFYTPSPELPPSGYYDRHPVHSDRDRLPTATYSRYPIPHQAPAYSPYRSNHPAPPPPPPFVNTEQIIPPKDGRARSGSSPAKPGFHH